MISDRKLEGVRILLAEDNPMNQFFAKKLLNKWGVTVEIASNGFEAVHLLERNNYDVVLLDLQMPEMNGFEVVKKIRDKSSELMDIQMPVMDGLEATSVIRNDLKSAIPVIALTADISTETKENVFKRGMDDFVLKPFEQKDIYSKILKYVN